MSDLPPFAPPYQPISAEFGRAMLAFENAPASAGKPASAAGAKGGLFFLVVPFAEKDEAKGLGAKWDAGARKWYVPTGKDNEIFKRWWPAA